MISMCIKFIVHSISQQMAEKSSSNGEKNVIDTLRSMTNSISSGNNDPFEKTMNGLLDDMEMQRKMNDATSSVYTNLELLMKEEKTNEEKTERVITVLEELHQKLIQIKKDYGRYEEPESEETTAEAEMV